jgi:hypothetical protein
MVKNDTCVILGGGTDSEVFGYIDAYVPETDTYDITLEDGTNLVNVGRSEFILFADNV